MCWARSNERKERKKISIINTGHILEQTNYGSDIFAFGIPGSFTFGCQDEPSAFSTIFYQFPAIFFNLCSRAIDKQRSWHITKKELGIIREELDPDKIYLS